MLIDCGALASTRGYRDETGGWDIKKTTMVDRGLANQHWDHISGFTQAKELFDAFDGRRSKSGPKIRTARRQLRNEFKKRKKAVEMALARIPDSKKNRQLGLYRKVITELFGFYGGLGAAATGQGRTEKAGAIFSTKPRIITATPSAPRLIGRRGRRAVC
jgi:hypothetical protein